MSDKNLKEKIKEKIAEVKRRKHMLGHVNITGVTHSKKVKPKKKKEEQKHEHRPGSVSIGAHGGRYIQEPSGHKRYVKEGQLSGVKRFKKSVRETLEDIVKADRLESFIQDFKKRNKNG